MKNENDALGLAGPAPGSLAGKPEGSLRVNPCHRLFDF
jgi:hypothetical protein